MRRRETGGMATTDDSGTSITDDLDELSRLLTAIARRTYTSQNSTEERYDFGELVSRTITTAAANLGSIDALLAGRPGSWEADHVRRIVESTTPADELHLHRTEPVRLILDPNSVFEDVGLQAIFEAADNELSDGYFNGTEPDDDGVNDDAVDTARAALEENYRADLDAYFVAYGSALQEIRIERGFHVPLELTRVENYQTEPAWDTLAEQLHAAARERTPLPTAA
jgi:hypothetical protein